MSIDSIAEICRRCRWVTSVLMCVGPVVFCISWWQQVIHGMPIAYSATALPVNSGDFSLVGKLILTAIFVMDTSFYVLFVGMIRRLIDGFSVGEVFVIKSIRCFESVSKLALFWIAIDYGAGILLISALQWTADLPPTPFDWMIFLNLDFAGFTGALLFRILARVMALGMQQSEELELTV